MRRKGMIISMEMNAIQRRAWAEIDLDALKSNYLLIRGAVAPETKICCVIKAGAYGHGARMLSRFYQSLGADFLAVSNLEEAIQVRRAGVTLPVLILGYTPAESASWLIRYRITQCVFSFDYGTALSQAALQAGGRVSVHIKLDTGMGRLGFRAYPGEDPAPETADPVSLLALPGLSVEGAFTHFSSADMGEEGRAYTLAQWQAFEEAVDHLKQAGADLTCCHAANSAAIFAYPQTAAHMVRAGLVLYGYAPDDTAPIPALRPALCLKTLVDQVKEVAPGDAISYGRTFVASKSMRVATLPIGYGDGLFRCLSDRAMTVTVAGQGEARLLGRICMDQCMVDVTDLPGVKPGDEVTVFGDDARSAAQVAALAGTIPYELLCALSERLPRIYRYNGSVVAVEDRLLPELGRSDSFPDIF